MYNYKDVISANNLADEIKNLSDLLYSKPNIPANQVPAELQTTNNINVIPEFNNLDNNIKNNTVKCTSIEDVLNTLDLLQRG